VRLASPIGCAIPPLRAKGTGGIPGRPGSGGRSACAGTGEFAGNLKYRRYHRGIGGGRAYASKKVLGGNADGTKGGCSDRKDGPPA
jgi:hypothetical protein